MPKLITGGLGFIGSHLARKLVKMGEKVVLFDVSSRTNLIADIGSKVKIVKGDLGDWAQFLDIIKKYSINCIYHTAAILSASAESSPLAAYTVNASGTFHVLEAARILNLDTVVVVSSISTYGPGVPDRVDDDTIQRPTTLYGITKVFGERTGEYYYKKYGVNFRGLRFPSIIGPGRGRGGASAYSSLIVQEAAAGRPYTAFVDEVTRIPLLYIEDAVRSIVSIEQAKESEMKRRVYNIEGFSPTAVRLAAAVKHYLPDARVKFSPESDMIDIVRSWPEELDGSNACRDWGWRTQYDLNGAVEHFIREFQEKQSLYE